MKRALSIIYFAGFLVEWQPLTKWQNEMHVMSGCIRKICFHQFLSHLLLN